MAKRVSAVSITGALLIGITSAALLSACSPEMIAQDAIENIIEEQTGVDIDVDAGGSLPSNWPAEVPLVDGTIEFGGTLGSGAETTWTLQIMTPDVESSFNDAKAKFAAAGFETVGDFSGGGVFTAIFDNGNFSVTVSTTEAGQDSYLSYLVVPSVE